MNAAANLARPRWRRWLLNRFVLVPGFIALLAAGWNAWVVTHDHGAPVEGAEVKLWVFDFTTFAEHATTRTMVDGSFAFTDNPSHNIQLSAEKPGVGRSPRVPVRLYFRSEDVVLKAPLLLSSAG
jgi:hypothetical protein